MYLIIRSKLSFELFLYIKLKLIDLDIILKKSGVICIIPVTSQTCIFI